MSCLVLFVPDTHEPWGDPRAKKALLARAAKLKPAQIIHLGDLYDEYLLSKYVHDPVLIDRRTVRSGRERGLQFLTDLAAIAETTLLRGNHEDRIYSRLADNPFLAWWFDGVGIPVPEGVSVEDCARFSGGPSDVLAIHGFRARRQAGQAAASLVQDTSIVQGHTHGLGLIWVTPEKWAMECGYLGKQNAPCFRYNEGLRHGVTNWRHGFGWLDDEGLPHLEAL